jgi:ribosomal-protein-serine acetyltransferase
MMGFPLRGINLCLRPFQTDDAQALYEAALESVDSVGVWMPWLDANYSLDLAQSWVNSCIAGLATGGEYSMGIFSRDGSQFFGAISINFINHQHNFVNIGYWVRTSRQRQGIAHDALRLMSEFGFQDLRFSRLEIVVAEDNLASRKLAEKIGAHFEGMARNRLLIHGKLHTAAMYSLVP